jgi:hypothetical protein
MALMKCAPLISTNFLHSDSGSAGLKERKLGSRHTAAFILISTA